METDFDCSREWQKHHSSYSVWLCLCRRQEYLPYTPSTQVCSAESGKINLFTFKHFFSPFVESRQNLPQWGMRATCSPLPVSSWKQPLDSAFCQVISSHHDSRWHICFPLTCFPQLCKRCPKQCSIILVWELSLVVRILFSFVLPWVVKYPKRLPFHIELNLTFFHTVSIDTSLTLTSILK